MTATSFHELIANPHLRKAIDAHGYEEPTRVQQQAIPPVLAGKNLIVSSKTGSGKTAAFLLPAFEKILAQDPINQESARILILTPTRELARQILKVAQQLLKFTHIKIGMVCGGEEFKYQKAMLRKNPEIIVGTPGRLAEHVQHKSTDFSGLEFLILDEADRMLEMGLSEDVIAIVNTCRVERQSLLFSATLEQTGLRHLIKQIILGDAEEIYVEQAANSIQQQMILSDDVKHKEKLLVALLEKSSFEKVVVFTNTKAKATQLDNVLRYHKYKVSALHGDITQDQRRINLDFFRLGKTQILVATDVAARGLDIPGVDLVINFDMAQSGDDYIHRIGRTGRADAEGRAVSFVAKTDWNLTKGIERYLAIQFEVISIPGLTAAYKGPDKVKSSGKAVGTKKKTDDKKTTAEKPKVKVRTKDKKNIGKRRLPSEKSFAESGEETSPKNQPSAKKTAPAQDLGDGFSAFKMKKKLS